ncbi:MAG: hypothetical protein ACLT0Y_02445 [Christensenellales bacterium]
MCAARREILHRLDTAAAAGQAVQARAFANPEEDNAKLFTLLLFTWPACAKTGASPVYPGVLWQSCRILQACALRCRAAYAREEQQLLVVRRRIRRRGVRGMRAPSAHGKAAVCAVPAGA